MAYREALQQLDMPLPKYLVRYGLPTVGLGLLVGILLVIAFSGSLPVALVVLLALGTFALAVTGVVVWPLAVADRKRMEIHRALPLFMTHFGVLATSNLPRSEIFRLVSEKKEYKALARELSKIHTLVTSWNLSVPQAARFVAQTTPSPIFADFLDRMAHALETGQELEDFLHAEQSVVMKDYATLYEASIYQVEQWKDIYASVVMSSVFFVVFSIITPIITDFDPNQLLIGNLVAFTLLELILLGVLRFRTPSDRLLHQLPIPVAERSRIRWMLLGAVGVSAALLAALAFTPLPLGLKLAFGVTPLAPAGLLAHRWEQRVKRREDNYAAFIRSLGSSVAARGGSARDVLKKMKAHNFGPLTALVHNVYARLTWRLNDALAWKHFAAESGSHLIDGFNEMFVEGLRAGGKPDAVGTIISDNVVRILNLRKSRYATASTFRGMLIGLTVAMAFVLFSSLAVLGTLQGLFQAVGVPQGELSPIAINFDVNQRLLSDLLLWGLVIHCFVAALMFKTVDGGGFTAGLVLFVVLVWLSVLIALLNAQLMDFVFGATGGG